MGKYDGHTPGPWEFIPKELNDTNCMKCDKKSVSFAGGIAGSKERWWIAAIEPNPHYHDSQKVSEAKANAELIADAPKILRERDEAVRQLLYHQHECSIWTMYHKHSSLCGVCNSCVVLKRIEEASNG